MYLILDFSAVDEVEDLQHDEYVEDEGEVTGVDACRCLDCLVV